MPIWQPFQIGLFRKRPNAVRALLSSMGGARNLLAVGSLVLQGAKILLSGYYKCQNL